MRDRHASLPEPDPVDEDDLAEARWLARREDFYTRALGPMRQPGVYHWIDDGNPHIDVYAFAKSAHRPFETLITGGLADRPQPDLPLNGPVPRRVEILLKIPRVESWAAMVLRELASLPFLFGVRLSPGVLVRGSRPVRPGSTLAHAVLSPAEEPGLAGFVVEGELVSFLRVDLITEEELRHGVELSGENLVGLLRERGVDPVVDLNRKSAV